MSETVRFLHTADLHLDSPLRSLATRNSSLSQLIQDASRAVLRRLVDTALNEQVDALIIAGDLFDGDQRDVRTAMVLQRELRRLNAGQIPAFIIKGNHDAEAKLLSVVDFPDNVHVFSGKGGTRYFADGKAAVHGVSFANRESPDSLLDKYPAPVTGCFNIGILHTSLTGADGHNNYAPCTVDELINMGYDYWALGHIHKRCVHHDDPAIVMPGNPLGRHINESGSRSISLVELAHDKPANITPVELAPVRFERVTIDLDGVESRSDALDLMLKRAEQYAASLDVPHLIFRVYLAGATDLATGYRQNSDALLTELQTEFEHRDDIWIDSVDLDALQSLTSDRTSGQVNKPTTHHADDGADSAASSGSSSVNELLSLVSDQLIDTANVRDAIQNDLNKLTRSLPGEMNELFSKQSVAQRQAFIHSSAQWVMQQLEVTDGDKSPDGRSDDPS